MYRDMKIQRFSAAFLLSAYVSPECDEMDQVHSSTESSMLKNSIECLSLLSDSRPICLDENDDKRLGISLIQALSVLFMKKNRHPCTDSNHCFSLSLIDFGKG
uniref:AlNc14C413G11467 protein n=1 Tax=Albugo laibachii Nc14 TaxID=890382 RepID=F0WZ61_9STRA|nr:AlNc14C413G11467 [Albugo laibachii Nc14]|eukprot:CCA26777.1 AlNc14C413G11467 [Albugo laibachii Nc14]